MFYALLLAVSIAINTSYNGVNSRAGKKWLAGTADRFFYLGLVFAAGSVVTLGFMLAEGAAMSAYTLAMGAFFGVWHVATTVMLVRALTLGPLALVNLIVSCSMVIPTFSGLLIWGEPVAGPQWAGVALMVVALALCADVFGKNNAGGSRHWLAVGLCASAMTGALGVLQKTYQKSDYSGEMAGFIAVSFVVSAAGAFLAWRLCRKRGEPAAEKPRFAWGFFTVAAGAGVLAGVLNHLNLFLIGVLPAVIFFPVCNGGTILCSAAVGRLLFKEKMTRAQGLGFVLGLAAILLLGNVVDLLSAPR